MARTPPPTLTPEAEVSLRSIGKADIVVGIPSLNSARTIGHVARAVQVGLLKYFPVLRSVVVNADGGSSDGSPEAVRDVSVGELDRLFVRHETEGVSRIVTPHP